MCPSLFNNGYQVNQVTCQKKRTSNDFKGLPACSCSAPSFACVGCELRSPGHRNSVESRGPLEALLGSTPHPKPCPGHRLVENRLVHNWSCWCLGISCRSIQTFQICNMDMAWYGYATKAIWLSLANDGCLTMVHLHPCTHVQCLYLVGGFKAVWKSQIGTSSHLQTL